MYKPRTALVALLMAILLVPCAFAQETTAGIQGSVKDPSGAVVANATIELTAASMLGSKKVTTDSSGVYRFAQLPVGIYTMTISAPGNTQPGTPRAMTEARAKTATASATAA